MSETILQQTELEHQNLRYVKEALRGAIAWDVPDDNDLARKLSSVRFVAQSFQRYLERLFALEEHDGYMAVLTETDSYLTSKLEMLRSQHEAYRETIRQIMPRLERISPEECDEFDVLCRELLTLVDRVTKHNQDESRLLQDAFYQDTGGEGGT